MQKKIDGNDSSVVADYNGLKNAYSILGFFINDSKSALSFIDAKNDSEIPQEVKALAEKRWQAKQNKDWTTADTLRAEITALGFVVKDKKDGYDIVKA